MTKRDASMRKRVVNPRSPHRKWASPVPQARWREFEAKKEAVLQKNPVIDAQEYRAMKRQIMREMGLKDG